MNKNINYNFSAVVLFSIARIHYDDDDSSYYPSQARNLSQGNFLKATVSGDFRQFLGGLKPLIWAPNEETRQFRELFHFREVIQLKIVNDCADTQF